MSQYPPSFFQPCYGVAGAQAAPTAVNTYATILGCLPPTYYHCPQAQAAAQPQVVFTFPPYCPGQTVFGCSNVAGQIQAPAAQPNVGQPGINFYTFYPCGVPGTTVG